LCARSHGHAVTGSDRGLCAGQRRVHYGVQDTHTCDAQCAARLGQAVPGREGCEEEVDRCVYTCEFLKSEEMKTVERFRTRGV